MTGDTTALPLSADQTSETKSNDISIKAISQLMGKKFWIPSYQRGYRWTKRQVEELLEDLLNFLLREKKDHEFYCLQPIIIKYDNQNDRYEVIDGQQRLTTIRIILSYIIATDFQTTSFVDDRGMEVYQIEYETRPGAGNFLKNITEGNDENIDYLHISIAYQVIREWFARQFRPGKVRDMILDAFTMDYLEKGSMGVAKIIWYEINNPKTNPIDTFIRINLGKISLTNSELIKALFLQERSLGQGDSAKLKQLEIAQQWDEIENKLQEDNFWWFLNRTENKASSHIEFIFDMMKDIAVAQNPDLGKVIGKDEFTTFRYFVTLFAVESNYETVKSSWDQVREYYEFFEECFRHPVWYHYIGFLIYCGITLQEIYDLIHHPQNITKDDATSRLITKIHDSQFKHLKWSRKPNGLIGDEIYLDLTYKSDKELLRRIMLLFNIEYIVNKSAQDSLLYKFPFKSFKLEKKSSNKTARWDIEHIASTTDNSLNKEDDQKIWLLNAKLDLPGLKEDLELITDIDSFILDPRSKSFEILYDRVLTKAPESKLSKEEKDSLGNLTLLDSGTNRGYGNALFSTKRRLVIEKDKSGKFIPICTKNVFFKYFDGNSKSDWTAKDIEGYRTTIEETLLKFLPERPESNEQI